MDKLCVCLVLSGPSSCDRRSPAAASGQYYTSLLEPILIQDSWQHTHSDNTLNGKSFPPPPPPKKKRFQTPPRRTKQTHCPHRIQEYLYFDLQELDSVYRLCSQLAYRSKTKARDIVWDKKEFKTANRSNLFHTNPVVLPQRMDCTLRDMVTESTGTSRQPHKGRKCTANRCSPHHFNECTDSVATRLERFSIPQLL